MMHAEGGLRIATYNIHKCRGLDGRVRPERIAEILASLNADIIALQEVVGQSPRARHFDQALYFAEQLDLTYVLGEARKRRGAAYGNVILSRFPLLHARNYDLSVPGFGRRACLRADIRVNGSRIVHIFNVHLGTVPLERRSQARRLVAGEILHNGRLKGFRIVLGDFNEGRRGFVARMLDSELMSADLWRHLGRWRTYPGMLPFANLDHIYFDPVFELKSLSLKRNRPALIASDHLPLIADFRLPAERGGEARLQSSAAAN